MPNRREFLWGAGLALGLPRLIGTALADGRHLSDAAPSLKGAGHSVVVPTHEHYGDIDERIDFPAAWAIDVMKMAGHDAPELSREALLKCIREPIGTRPLSELAAGKKSAVITFDDLARPTPIADVAPLVVRELTAAGMREEQIFFLGSFGAHRTMEQNEVAQKLGPELVRRHAWFNHNVFDGLQDIGQTKYRNRIYANRLFMGADLRITISGVKCHSISGYGGGAKAVLPGVAGLKSIHHNHQVIGSNNKTVAELKIFTNEVRLDMAEAARLAGVDFSVQIVYNNRRRACAVFAGDIVGAHTEACRSANRLHRTPTARGADVVVVNTYPQAAQGTKAQAWINRCVREGGTGVLIMQHPVGVSAWHYLYQPGYSGGGDPLAVLTPKTGRAPNYGLIVYSQYIQKPQMDMFPPGTVFATRWDDVIRGLNARHKGDSRVAVYPYGTLQHTETDLDG